MNVPLDGEVQLEELAEALERLDGRLAERRTPTGCSPVASL